jgi:hypothetical protein
MENNLSIAPDYDSTEFAPLHLLEQGDVDVWVRRRGAILIEKSKDIAKDCEAGKLASVLTVGASMVMSSNPLAWIPMAIGAGGYIYTIFQEFQDTGSFRPIPMYRGKLGDVLRVMEGKEAQERHPLEDQIEYLSEVEKDEMLLINYRFGEIAGVLNSAPPKVRFDLYRHICGQFHARRDLLSGEEVAHYINTATSEARRTAIAPNTPPELPLETPKEVSPTPVENEAIATASDCGADSETARTAPPPTPAVSDSASHPVTGTSSRSSQQKPGVGSQEPALGTKKVLRPFDRDRIISESKGLMIIGDMGAAKTCVVQYIANGFDGCGIIIFDPHGMTDWGNAYVLTKMGAIYEQMRILLDLLENGDTTPLLIICDEWLEIRGDRRNKKGSEYAGLADDFIRLFSTKPRKFNKLAGFVLHSPNVEAAGVDSFLRENYLKIYLGRLAKKEFPHIQDCAYPCVLEDEQQEHPTHGHHTEFKPKGKAPRNLQPLNSAPINIPLAYMDGAVVKVCDRGWADGQLRLEVENIRQRLELLLDSSTPEPNPEPSEPTVQKSEPPKCDSEPLNQPVDEGSEELSGGSEFSSEPGSERFTPLNLSKEQVLALIENLNHELNQTQIIERLWQVKKGGSAAWKEAREQFKQLTGE